MKKVVIYLLCTLILVTLSSGSIAQEEFDNEFVNLNNNMHVKTWFAETTVPVLDYLRSKACEEGRIKGDGPFISYIDGRKAYGMCAFCSEMRRPYQLMLFAVPLDEGIYMIRIKCPEDCYTQHKLQIEQLLDTILANQQLYFHHSPKHPSPPSLAKASITSITG